MDAPYSKEAAFNYAPGNYKSQLSLYAGEIAYTDHCIGQVLKRLKELKLYDSTLIIITGDHGEMLWEHGEPAHAYFIYQSAIKVPMIFKLPGKNKSRQIETIVGLVDIVPTVCKLLDVEIPGQVHGKDLSGYFRQNITNDPDRVLFCESLTATKFTGNSLLGVVSNRWKYIQTTRPELYDLIEDPHELNDLIREQPHRARLLKDRLQEIIERSVRREQSKIKLDTEAIQKLESLGYVAGDIEEDFTFDQSKDDPKDLIDLYQSVRKVDFLTETGDLKAAKELCLELLDQKPELHLLYKRMITIADHMKDNDAAISYLNKAVELKPDDFDSFFSLGLAFINKNEPEEAKKNFQRALQINPDLVDAKLWLATIYQKQKQYTEAVKYLEEALILKPDSVPVFDNIASIYFEQGKLNQAVDYWTKALELKPNNIKFLNALAWIYAACNIEELRNPSGAVDLAERACKLTEYKDPEVLDTMSAAYGAAGAFDKAVETARKAIDLARSKNKDDLADRIQARLDLYRQAKPFLDPNLKPKRQ
jgi:tetratricopeptide (TPR) repeat protein